MKMDKFKKNTLFKSQNKVQEKKLIRNKTRNYDLVALAIIFLLGIIIYSNSLSCSFHLDDYDNIVNNTKIHNISDVNAWWNFSSNRPVSMFTFVLNYYFNELDVTYYHLVNLIIHLINAFLVWSLTLLILSSKLIKDSSIFKNKKIIAFFTSLLFISHPLATQSVTYIVQRQTSIATLFYLFSLIMYVKARYSDKKTFKMYALFFGSFVGAILAFFSKENAYTLPFTILLIEIFFIQEKKFKLNFKDYRLIVTIVSFAIIIALILLKFKLSIFNPIEPSQSMGNAITITSENYLYTQFSVIVKYIQLLFLPINQNVDYDFPISNRFFEIKTILSFGFLISLLALAIYLFKRNRIISFGIFWFFITLSIESSFIPITDVIFEHRTYLPSFGFFLILSSGIFYFLAQKHKKLAIVILLTIVGINSILTYNRNKVWKNDITLWTDTVRKSPNKARPLGNLGVAYGSVEQWDKAIDCYSKSIKISPIYFIIYYNRGLAFGKQNRLNEAIDDYSKSIEINPKYASSYMNRGIAYSSLGLPEKAIPDYSKTIELEPSFSAAYFNRGLANYTLGNWKDAIADFSGAIWIDSNFAIAYVNRGVTYDKFGQIEMAIADYTKAINIDPELIFAFSNRGLAYNFIKQYDLAISDFSKAIELDPNNPKNYFDRAVACGNIQQWENAVKDYSKAIEINPNFNEAKINRDFAIQKFSTSKKNK